MACATLDLIPAAQQQHESLTVFPLVTEREVELPYLLLADAVAEGTLAIREVGSGTVPELAAVNTGETAVLILDGEQLLGAKQNRMASRTILLPPRKEMRVPVSCMERGRWSFGGDPFRPAPQHSPAKLRRTARAYEAAMAERGRTADAHCLAEVQGEVWEEIDDVSLGLGVRSPTGALDQLYEARGREVEAWVAAFSPVRGQVGLIAFFAELPLGLDVIGGRELYRRLHGRLLRGYAMDVLWRRAVERGRGPGAARGPGARGGPGMLGAAGAAGGRGTPGGAGAPGDAEVRTAVPDEAAALRYLDAVQKATRAEAPTVGLGRYRVLSGAVVGGELEHEERLVHRAAFPGEGEGWRRGTRIHRPKEADDCRTA